MSRSVLLLSLALTLGLAGPLSAHALLHEEVSDGNTVTVHFYYPGEREKPWFEPYEVFSPSDELAFQEGRVNAIGEVSFRPNEPGEWRIRVATGDGHGSVVRIQVAEEDLGSGERNAQLGYTERAIMAVGYLLGGFGLWILWRQRKHLKTSRSND